MGKMEDPGEGAFPKDATPRRDATSEHTLRDIKFEGKKVRCFTFTDHFTGTAELEEMKLIRDYVH